MRAAVALTKDAPALTETERLERIQRWTKSAAAVNRTGVSRDLQLDLKKIRTSLDPKDHITSRIVVNEFEKFIDNKRAASDKKVQFLSSRAEAKDIFNRNKKDAEEMVESSPIRPHTSVDVSQSGQWKRATSKSSRSVEPQKSTEYNGPKLVQRSDHRDPAWWHRKIRQGYLETEEMISKLVYQRKAEEKQLGVRVPVTRASEYVSRKFPHTNHERRRLDRSMERLRKKHEVCFGKPLTASELDSMSGRGTTEQRLKKRKGAISRVSGVHVPNASHLSTRDPIPLPKTMTSHLEDNWTPPRFPRSSNQQAKLKELMEAQVKKESSKNKKEIKVLYAREQNVSNKGAATPEKTTSLKANAFRSEWVDRLYEAKAKKVTKQAEMEKEIIKQEKEDMNALYKELVMNKRRLAKNENMNMDWHGKRVPSWKQMLAGSLAHGGTRKEGSMHGGPSARRTISKNDKWNERPPKGLGMWLEGVLAKAKRQQELARGAPGPVTEAFMRPLTSYHY